MKNSIRLMLIMLCGMMMATAFVACGGDDDSGGSNQNSTPGGLEGEAFTIVHLLMGDPVNVYIYKFDATTGTKTTYSYSESPNYYSPTLDADFPQKYNDDGHSYFTYEGEEYFSYTYNSKNNFYLLDYYGYDPTLHHPYDAFRLNLSSSNPVCQSVDELGEIVYTDYMTWELGQFYNYDLPFYQYWSGGGSGGGTTCTSCSGTGKCVYCDGTGNPNYYDRILGKTSCGFCKGTGKCTTCGGSGYVNGGSSGGSSGGGSGTDYDATYDFYSTTAIKIIKTKGTALNNDTYSRSTESMLKGIRKSDGNVYLFSTAKRLIGSASRNTDSSCGNYNVSSKDYKTTVSSSTSSTTYYYFD